MITRSCCFLENTNFYLNFYVKISRKKFFWQHLYVRPESFTSTTNLAVYIFYSWLNLSYVYWLKMLTNSFRNSMFNSTERYTRSPEARPFSLVLLGSAMLICLLYVFRPVICGTNEMEELTVQF